MNNVKINISRELNINAGVIYSFKARYSDSILMGFYYRNGRQHPEFDYVMEVLGKVDLSSLFLEGLKSTNDLQKAFDYTADKVYEAYVDFLSSNKSGYETLNWWFRDHEPDKHITQRKA